MAERVAVPRRNVVPKPASLSFAEAAASADRLADGVPDALHARRAQAGETVLVQGAGGGVATAAIVLGRAAGLRVLVTSRDEAEACEGARDRRPRRVRVGERLPEKADAVIETVGKATWSHSVRSLRPGGRIITSGTTSGPNLDDAELTRIFFLQLSRDRLDDGHPRRAGRAGRPMLDATGAAR